MTVLPKSTPRQQNKFQGSLHNLQQTLRQVQGSATTTKQIKVLALCFKSFFITKIENIRKHLLAKQPLDDSPPSDTTGAPCLDSFRHISCEEPARFVHSCPSKSCESDPVPTDLLKGILPVTTHSSLTQLMLQ